MTQIENESSKKENIRSQIWREVAEDDNAFAAKECYCSGYDVYGELLSHASWAEYIYLLFKLQKPTQQDAHLLEAIAIAIANPGPRDHSVRAAMNAGVGGSTNAAALMAALAVGAGQYGGAHEIASVIYTWEQSQLDINRFIEILCNPDKNNQSSIWPEINYPPGFDPYGTKCAKPVLQTLNRLHDIKPDGTVSRLKHYRQLVEDAVGYPLAMTGVIGAALHDLKMHANQGEMLYLLLRLPGAAVHAMEQEGYGWRKYPFFKNGLKLLNDPGPK